MAGFDVPGPEVRDPATGYPVTVNKATVLRLELAIPDGQAAGDHEPDRVANGFGQRADKDVFLIGPTGLALGAGQHALCLGRARQPIVAIPDATDAHRPAPAPAATVTKDGLLQRPLALAMAPNGHLLVCNGKNGQVVEIDPGAGKQLYAQWIDTNQAQSPPGNGDLFGIAMTPDGKGFYYVEDDVNTLVEATR